MTQAAATETKPDQPLVSMGDLDISATPKPADAKPSEPAPEMQEVKIGEKSFAIPKDVAVALEQARQAGVDVGSLKSQVAELSGKLEKAMAPAKEKTPDESGYDTILFTDPNKAIQKLRAEIVEEVRGEMRSKEAENVFWTEMFSQNKDLEEYKDYVRMVFARDRSKHVAAKITVQEVINRVAETSKAELLKLRGGVPIGKSKPTSEGGNEPGNKSKAKDSKVNVEDTAPRSTASILAQRREARRAASKPGRK